MDIVCRVTVPLRKNVAPAGAVPVTTVEAPWPTMVRLLKVAGTVTFSLKVPAPTRMVSPLAAWVTA